MVEDTAEFINTAIEEADLSEELIKEFKNDVYIFSGLKTHSQLLEASKLLFTKDNKLKSFEAFSKDIEKLKKDYNENYLEAEHDYAQGTMQQVERWESFSDSDRYNLQYRTAGDSQVRDSHAALHNITLPKSDPFWLYYSPKNGWRCRCSVVEVLASITEVSNRKKAMSSGEKATTQIGKNGKNKLEIFRYNPAIKKVVFPPKHPYNKVIGAKKIKTMLRDEL